MERICSLPLPASSIPLLMAAAFQSSRPTFYLFYLYFCFPGLHTQHMEESSQAMDQIKAALAGLHHSHSNTGSKPNLQPTPQLTETLDHHPTDRGWRSNPHPHGYYLDLSPLHHNRNSKAFILKSLFHCHISFSSVYMSSLPLAPYSTCDGTESLSG